MRPDRWWQRWYVVRAVPAFPIAGVEADEWVECATLTRFGARRVCRWVEDPALRAVRRKEWLTEHA